jgi:hypothetical protein
MGFTNCESQCEFRIAPMSLAKAHAGNDAPNSPNTLRKVSDRNTIVFKAVPANAH